MPSWLSTGRLARTSTRHPWLVLAIWAALLISSAFGAFGIGNVLSTSTSLYVEKDSQKADRLIGQQLSGAKPVQEFVVVRSNDYTVDDPQFQAVVENVVSGLRGFEGDVTQVFSYYDTRADAMVSGDRHTTVVPVTLSSEGSPSQHSKPVISLAAKLDGKDGFTVVTGGDGSISHAFQATSERDLRTAEFIGLPVALVVLVAVFGAVAAAGLPLALGFVSIVVATGVTFLIGQMFDLSTFVLNMISMIGLAVGIDYSLLIVQRFREERRHGLALEAAIERAGATASRAVLFSGLTVIVALAGLLIVPDSIFRSMATGAITVVVVAITAALTLLPASLRLLGDRVNFLSLRIPFVKRRNGAGGLLNGFWTVTTRFVTKHALLSVLLSVAVLGAAAVPYLSIRLGNSGVSSLPQNTSAARAFTMLNEDFSAGMISPARVVISAPNVESGEVQAGIHKLEQAFKNDAAFGTPSVEVNEAGNLAVVSVPLDGDPQGDAAAGAISRLRGQYVPEAFPDKGSEALVTGDAASAADYRSLIDDYTPIVFAFVLGLSFLILLVVFRSIVVPVKAILMNLLSVGAAYGLMVVVFQHGLGTEIFGFTHVDRIEAWIPLFMFAMLFGLSMDYHVFLLTRIRERWEETRDNLGSVAFGVRSTAGMITGAALIMVAVFSGFAAGELSMFQQIGFGLAVAIILDATIVRTVLVPASMALLGDLNWYLPRWLSWLPKLDVEGSNLSHGA